MRNEAVRGVAGLTTASARREWLRAVRCDQTGASPAHARRRRKTRRGPERGASRSDPGRVLGVVKTELRQSRAEFVAVEMAPDGLSERGNPCGATSKKSRPQRGREFVSGYFFVVTVFAIRSDSSRRRGPDRTDSRLAGR